MLLTERSTPLNDARYTHEIKFDGYRILAEANGTSASLQSRNGADATSWFSEVVTALATLGGKRHVFDGEVCVLDEYGRSDFDRVHRRARRRRLTPDTDPVVFCVFDLLVHQGRDIRQRPLAERRALLEKVLPQGLPSLLRIDGVPGEEGTWLYRQACALELEGTVSKRLDSPYESGVRSNAWIKVKRPGAVPAQRFSRGARKTT